MSDLTDAAPDPGAARAHPGPTAHPAHRIGLPTPATEWVEALPLGNGRLGAMVYGGVERELVWLSEGSVWSGPHRTAPPHPVTAERAAAALADARAALDAGDPVAAERALQRLQHSYPQSFQPLARLRRARGTTPEPAAREDVVPERDEVDHPDVPYRRQLDLATATATTHADGAAPLRQRAFVSAPDGVLVLEVSSDDPVAFVLDSPLRLERAGAADGEAWVVLRAPDDVAPRTERTDHPVRWTEQPRGVQAAVALRTTDGTGVDVRTTPDGVVLHAPRGTTLLLAVETTFTAIGQDPTQDVEPALARARGRAAAAVDRGVDALHATHVADHRALYDRAELRLGTAPEPGADEPVDTDALLETVAVGDTARVGLAPELVGLLFQYGRYLLISSSRPGGTPANLQGIWNQQLQPPWSSDFTMNINTEMSYWLAETTGLPECAEPLFGLVEALAVSGREPAARIYGSSGWTAHHASDVWAFPDPMGDGTHDPSWAFWPFAGVWLCTHLVDRVTFAHDPAAAARFWPTLCGAARFVLDWLRPRPDGTLGTSPSTSPENRYVVPGTERGSSVASDSTMDLELSRHLLASLLRVAERYDLHDDALLAEAAQALPRIAVTGVDGQGLLREWDDVEEMVDPHHRHLVHLVAIHPTDAPPPSAAHAAAASRSLDARGDEGTGWSLAWKMAMRARLHDPDGVQRLLDLYVRRAGENTHEAGVGRWRGGLYRNLFSAHPPFQIDGNLGLVASLAECLVQSHAGHLELLPALPPDLSDGQVRGLRARGDLEVDVLWRDGALVSARVASHHPVPRTVRVVAAGRTTTLTLAPGASVDLTPSDLAEELAS